MVNFTHLRVHTDYSLGFGVIKIKALIAACKSYGMQAVGISDRYNLFGSLEFSIEAVKAGLQPITGSVIKVVYDHDSYHKPMIGELLFIAKNDTGYKNLLKLSSKSYLNNLYPQCISLDMMQEHREGIIVLCGTKNCPAFHYFINNNKQKAIQFISLLDQIYKDHLYIELLRRGNAIEDSFEDFILNIAYGSLNLPVVATNEVCFLTPDMQWAQDTFLCIANNNVELRMIGQRLLVMDI